MKILINQMMSINGTADSLSIDIKRYGQKAYTKGNATIHIKYVGWTLKFNPVINEERQPKRKGVFCKIDWRKNLFTRNKVSNLATKAKPKKNDVLTSGALSR